MPQILRSYRLIVNLLSSYCRVFILDKHLTDAIRSGKLLSVERGNQLSAEKDGRLQPDELVRAWASISIQ